MKTRFELFAAENRKLDDQLSQQDYVEFDQLMTSLNPVRMGRVRSELVRRDLLMLAKDARAQGQTLEQSLGEDSHRWCARMMAAGGYGGTAQTVLEAI